MVWTRTYPGENTYRGIASQIITKFGSSVLPPSEDMLANTVASEVEANGYRMLKIEITKKEVIPVIYYEFTVTTYCYAIAGVGLIPPLVLAGIIIAAIIALGIIWLIFREAKEIVYGVGPVAMILFAGALLIGVGVIAYYLVKERPYVERAAKGAYHYAKSIV